MKQEYESFMRITPCKTCGGQRLKKSALAVTVADKNIAEITAMSIGELQQFMEQLVLTQQQELRPAPYPAARRSGFVWRRRLARAWSVWRTFWTSRASDCISGIMTSCSVR